MVQGLDHIALIVSSEDSLRFYEKLGFRETERFERSYDIVVFMTCGNITLEIFVDPNHPERVNSPEAKGLRHVAVTVDKIEDLNMEIEEIRIYQIGATIEVHMGMHAIGIIKYTE